MLKLVRRMKRWQRARETSRVRRAHIGAHSEVHSTVQVLGWKNVRIGERSIVSEDCWLNVNDRESAEVAISIGNHCFIGRRNFLSSGSRITIGDYCLTGVDCHFLGSDHAMENPFVPYVATGTTSGGAIIIGANCWIGAGVTVLKEVTVGYGCILGARTLVLRDVPPLSIVVGNPGRVVKRFDVRRNTWVPAADYPPDGDAHLPGEEEYVARLRQAQPTLRGPLIASGHDFGDL